MGAKADQLALCAPDGDWNVRRLTERQQGVLEWARLHGEVRPRELRRSHGYRHPSSALKILERRGLLLKVKRGLYAPVAAPVEKAI